MAGEAKRVGSQWYNRVDSEISQYRITSGRKNVSRYKLDFLLRIAGRVDEFSPACDECRGYQKDIDGLVQGLGILIKMPEKNKQKNYSGTIYKIAEHLKKSHNLVEKGHYTGIGIGLGMAVGGGLGAVLGAVLDNPGIGTGIGIALGAAVGAYMDRKAKEEGRLI